MSLKQTLQEELKNALKSKDETKISTVRFLNAAIKNEEINKSKREEGLSDDEITSVIARQIKQRKDAIEQFTKGGREDLTAKEKKELAILQSFMPAQMSEEEIRAVAREIIAGGAIGFGAVMSAVMQRLKGKAEGVIVKKIVEEVLHQ